MTAAKASSLSSKSTKADRRNAAKVEQKRKREQLTQGNRIFQGNGAAPKLVAIVPLCNDVSTEAVLTQLTGTGGVTVLHDGQRPLLRLDQFKQKVQLIQCKPDLIEILDAAKLVDYIIYVLSAVEEVDEFGKMCLSAVAAQGVVSPIAMVQHLDKVPAGKRQDIKRSLQLFMQDRFPGEQRLFSVESPQDCSACLRTVANMRTKSPLWRERHPYLVADKHEFVQASSAQDITTGTGTGTLRLTGYVRGTTMSVNKLVHMVGVGSFQLASIEAARKPDDRRNNNNNQDTDMMSAAMATLAEPDPLLQEPLVSENEVDPMAGEQTWPTEEELQDGEHRQREAMMGDDAAFFADGQHSTANKKKKRMPKGTSAYQAEWILDEEEEEEEESDLDEDGDDGMNGHGHAGSAGSASEEEEEEMVDLDDNEQASDDDDDDEGDDALEEDEEDYDEYLKRRQQQREDAQFPDEVDTPRNLEARVRFQKYRGLKSFRTSPWDPMENLPVDYSRIFQFENFKRTRHRVFKQIGEAGIEPGTYVTLNIKDFPMDAVAQLDSARLVGVFSLLQHENKMSMVNMAVTKTSEYEEPVKSKDEMLVQIGFRRFWASPIYSTDTRGGVNNVHKFERFLQPGRQSIAAAYLPIQFGPAPVLFLKPGAPGTEPALVATGSVLDSDPLRIIAKRIILTGHPFKIHKRSVVVRYMFWNPLDIDWFKPVQLHTKLGRTGHIVESLGTHGHMKCQFDGPVKAQDTICMYLYKRQYPKWNTRVGCRGRLR